MSWQLFDRLAAFFKDKTIHRQESLFQDQYQLDKLTAGGDFLNFGTQSALLEQTNLQINRLERYKDFDQMDEVGAITLALDLYGEEASLIDPELKHSMTVKAKSKRVKEELEGLFYDTLMIDNILRGMVRYLCKYGDFAAEIIPTKNRTGVSNIKFMNVYNFTRIETKFGDLVGFFFQDQLSSTPAFLHPWQVMHLRLTSYENIYHPYGKCEKFGTRIHTPSGYKNIEDFKKGDDVFVYHDSKLVPTKVVAACHSGEKEIFKIKTRHFENNCSGNHPVLVRRWAKRPFKFGEKWFADLAYKRADELVVGDELVIPKVDDSSKEYQILGDVKGNVVEADEKFAKLFGFLIGDGWLNRSKGKNRGIEFACGEYDDRNEYYTGLLNEYSPNKTIAYKKIGSRSILVEDAVRTYSVDLANFVEGSCGFIQGSKSKRIPQWVYNSPRSVKVAFIEGLLDADGSSNVDEWGCDRLQIELANYELVKDVKMLVHDIGWKCGQILKRNRDSDVVVFHGEEYNRSDAWYVYFYKSDLFADAHKSYRFRGGSRMKECGKFGNNTLFEPIVSIELDGFHPTADIQVEHVASNFVADGVVVHNSLLDGARKHFKQLRLMEDAALIYRITRAPEKRVFTIPVGNIPTAEVDQYIQNIARQFKKKQFFDPSTGDVNERWHPLIQEDDFWLPQRCLSRQTKVTVINKENPHKNGSVAGVKFDDKVLQRSEDTSRITTSMSPAISLVDTKTYLNKRKIGSLMINNAKTQLLNSQEKTLGELIDEYGHMDKEFWVYSYDKKLNKIIPAKAKVCVSPKDQQMVRVNLDNGKSIECTPDHKFMARSGEWVEAKDLQPDQSLMPLYRRKRIYYGNSDYEQIKQPDGEWEWTHKVVVPEIPKNFVRHHRDFNRFNNDPDNFEILHFEEHRKLHQEHGSEVLKKVRENNPEAIRRGVETGIIKWNKDNPELRKEIARDGVIKAWENGKYSHIKPENHKDWIDLDNYKKTWKELIAKHGSIRASVREWNDNPELLRVWKANKNTITSKILEQWGHKSIQEFAGIKIELPQKLKHLQNYGNKIKNLVNKHGALGASKVWNDDSELLKIWKANNKSMATVAKAFGATINKGGPIIKLNDETILRELSKHESVSSFRRSLSKNQKISKNHVTRVLKRNGYRGYEEYMDKMQGQKPVVKEFYEGKKQRVERVGVSLSTREKLSRSTKRRWVSGEFDDRFRGKNNKSYVDLGGYEGVWRGLIVKHRGNVRAAVREWNSDSELVVVWKANHQNLLTKKILGEWGYSSVDDFCGVRFVRATGDLEHYHDELVAILDESCSFFDAGKRWNAVPGLFGVWNANHATIKSYCESKGIDLAVPAVNHRVVSVEFLVDRQDTFCLVVPETGCFFTSAGVLVHNSDGTGPTITTLPGAENLDDIKDIEYFKKNMVSALKIPFERVGLGESTGSNERSLSQVSPDFAKSVQWIQREVAIGLKKIAIVHLALNGYSAEDIRNFDIHMTASSAIDELYRIEVWQSRANVIDALRATEMFPKRWILERFTDMTEDELNENEEDMKKMQSQQMQGMGGMGGMGMPGGGMPGGPMDALPPGEPMPLGVGADDGLGGVPGPEGGPPGPGGFGAPDMGAPGPGGFPEGYNADLERELLIEMSRHAQEVIKEEVVREDVIHDRGLFTPYKSLVRLVSGFDNMMENCELDGLSVEAVKNPYEADLVKPVISEGLRKSAIRRVKMLLVEDLETESVLPEEITENDLPSRMVFVK